jgi:hypothetical protein
MNSAWSATPLDIYEAHVNLPQVGQAAAIRASLAAAAAHYRPASLLYLGCAGGNGLDSFPPSVRIEAVDLNAGYLESARSRFPHLDLRPHAADLNQGLPGFAPVDFAFAALVLEYINPLEPLLTALHTRAAHFRVLLLGTNSGAPAVVDSPYREALLPVGAEFRYLDPEAFLSLASSCGWHLTSSSQSPLPAGKHFTTIDLKSSV